MSQDIKQLIERLREHHNLDLEQGCEELIYGEAADALECLTQPVGVEPDEITISGRFLYSAETVARLQVSNAQLQAERDELVAVLNRLSEFNFQHTGYYNAVLAAKVAIAKIEGGKV